MEKKTIYIIDDEKTIRTNLSFGLSYKYQVETFASAEESWPAFERQRPDLVLLDLSLPGKGGLELLSDIMATNVSIPVIIISANSEIPIAIEAMKRGAQNYLTKPIQLDPLKMAISMALKDYSLKTDLNLFQAQALRNDLPFIIGTSNAITEIMDCVAKIAKGKDTPVLITGESGTGKELLAKAIHYQSRSRHGDFVAVNCAAIPENLLESEFFGYAKGAFTGALPNGRIGFIEQAENGTLFLDEIGDLHLDLQAKLLRFMENGEFYRVGDSKARKCGVRVISATNKNLEHLASTGEFRLDLFYRLAVVQLKIPSLKERPQDIMPMARYFLKELNHKHERHFEDFALEVEAALLGKQWVGNIRELKNIIERGVLLGDEPLVTLADLGLNWSAEEISPLSSPQFFDANLTLPPEGLNLELLEKRLVMEAYDRAEGNDRKAAALLGMNYYTYRYRRKALGD